MDHGFDIEYHSRNLRKAQITEEALRGYLAAGVMDMSTDDILAIAAIVEECRNQKAYESKRITEYREKQAAEAGPASADEAPDIATAPIEQITSEPDSGFNMPNITDGSEPAIA